MGTIHLKFVFSRSFNSLVQKISWVGMVTKRSWVQSPHWGKKIEKYFLFFGWLLWSLWDLPLSTCHIATESERRIYPISLRCVQVPVTIQETGECGTYTFWLLSSQTSIVSMNEDPKICLIVWLKMCLYVLYKTCVGVK